MKISEIKPLAIPTIKVVRFARFTDVRGYFTETFRNSDFSAQLGLSRYPLARRRPRTGSTKAP